MTKAAEAERSTAQPSVAAATAAFADQAETLKNAMRMPQEMARFYAMRMKQDFETIEALGRCKTPVEVVNVWSDAAQKAVRDYQEGAARILDASLNGAAHAKS